MLTQYLTDTQNLLQNPGAPSTLYSTTSLTRWINIARGQIAGDGECVRYNASLATVIGIQSYAFSALNTGTSSVNGIQGPLNCRQILRTVTGGKTSLNNWPWEWFNQYYVAVLNVANAAPTDWAQYGQGVNGSLYFYPTPDAIYSLTIDTLCYPIALTDDATVDAIPYPWTDCVPYFAAYLALLSAQASARTAEADRMYARYEEFKQRARRISTSAVLPYQYEQSGMRTPPSPGGLVSTNRGGQ